MADAIAIKLVDLGKNNTPAETDIMPIVTGTQQMKRVELRDLKSVFKFSKADLGLDNVLNVEQIPTSEKGVPGGVATLGEDGKVVPEQLNPPFMEIKNSEIDDTYMSGIYFVHSPSQGVGSNTLTGYLIVTKTWGSTAPVTHQIYMDGFGSFMSRTHTFEWSPWQTVVLSDEFNAHTTNKNNPHETTKAQIGLDNVLNVEQIPVSEKGIPGGVATLGEDGKVPPEQLWGLGGGIEGWTEHKVLDHIWSSIAYGNGLFVAITSDYVMTSPDGINWTEQQIPIRSWNSIVYGNGVFVITSSSSVLVSPDGVNWTEQQTSDRGWNSITYGNGLFVAVGSLYGYSHIMISPDGINWTEQQIPNRDWGSITYGNGLFVAVTMGYVRVSPDGINWTEQQFSDRAWPSITYGNGLFVVIADDYVMVSPDGVNWTEHKVTDHTLRSIAYENGIFVAVASGHVLVSPDGINWTEQQVPNRNWNSIAYGNGVLVVVGNGYVMVMQQSLLPPAPEAPADSKIYARQNKEWVDVKPIIKEYVDEQLGDVSAALAAIIG